VRFTIGAGIRIDATCAIRGTEVTLALAGVGSDTLTTVLAIALIANGFIAASSFPSLLTSALTRSDASTMVVTIVDGLAQAAGPVKHVKEQLVDNTAGIPQIVRTKHLVSTESEVNVCDTTLSNLINNDTLIHVRIAVLVAAWFETEAALCSVRTDIGEGGPAGLDRILHVEGECERGCDS